MRALKQKKKINVPSSIEPQTEANSIHTDKNTSTDAYAE